MLDKTLATITAPSVPAVSIFTAKTHLRVNFSDDDTYIGVLCDAASRFAEQYTGRRFITQTVELKMDKFPEGDFVLPVAPISSVDSVKYDDTSDTEQTYSTSNYRTDTATEPGRIQPVSSWPATKDKLHAVRIRMTVGYGAGESDVPDGVAHAIKLMVAHWYENREPVTMGTIVVEVPMTVYHLLDPYRIAFL